MALLRSPSGGGGPQANPIQIGPSGVVRPANTGLPGILPPQPTPANQVGPNGGPVNAGNVAVIPSGISPTYYPDIVLGILLLVGAYYFSRKA